METFLYTSDIEGIQERIKRVLSKSKSHINKYSDTENIQDYQLEDSNITEEDYKQEEIEGETIDESANTENKPFRMSSAEMRLCEMEMVKYKQMLAQHKYEKGFRKKASILERELNSKTVVRECESLADFAKALDVSHAKWLKCSKKTKEKYIKEFTYRKYGIPIEKKTRKAPVSSKKRKSAFNVESINLNNCESGAEPNICIKSTGIGEDGAKIYTKTKKTKKEQADKKKKKIELPEEMTEELTKYLQNLNGAIYDKPDNITYDPNTKRIIELFLA